MRLAAPFLDDPGLQAVLAALAGAGYRGLVVGGAVRNALLGQPVTDLDLATDARPEAVMALAEGARLRAVPTGIAHGTVTVVVGSTPFEITTFRRDVATDGRRATVAYTTALAEDAARRDFTMNALYMDAAGAVIDPLGEGLADLRAGRLRFVGDADARIREDYLRILRFFRFHAHYGRPGGADAAALAACAAGREGLARISPERIGAEMRKLLAAPDPVESLDLMRKTGVLAQILPGASTDAMPRLIAAERAAGVAPDWRRRLGAMEAPDAARLLRLSRAEALHLRHLSEARSTGPAAAAFHFGPEIARDGVLLAEAGGQVPPPGWPALIEAAGPLPVTAADLAPLNGPALGAALKRAEAAWIASDFRASRAEVIARALETAAGKA